MDRIKGIFAPISSTINKNVSDDTLFYHYTSTWNANQIRLCKRILKKHNGVLLTTLNPEKYSREEVLRNNYGDAISDFHKNKADQCVVINPHNLKMSKLIKIDNERDVYRYQGDIDVEISQVMDKPRCEQARKIQKIEKNNECSLCSGSNSNTPLYPANMKIYDKMKLSNEYTIKINLRNDIKFEDINNPFYQDNLVYIVAPIWVEQAIKGLMNKIDKKLSCQIYSNYVLKDKLTITEKLSLKQLVQIARNESFNTGGQINFENYDKDLSKSIIFSLKDLVRQCVIVGSDLSTYNIGYNSEPKNKVYICDLIGLQFQQNYNTGRLVLIGHDIPYGYLDDMIFTHIVGEHKITYEEAMNDKSGRYQKYQEIYFDQKAYIMFVANDVIISGLALEKCVSEDINFKFLKYGTGYFAGPFKNILNTLIYEGVGEGLQKLLPRKNHIKAIELPFFEFSEKIQIICAKFNVPVKFSKDDALMPTHPHFLTGTTNCADPHAIIGNKMGFTSVDGAIAEKLSKKGINFSPIINRSIQEIFINI